MYVCVSSSHVRVHACACERAIVGVRLSTTLPNTHAPTQSLLYNARDGLLQRSIAGGKSREEVRRWPLAVPQAGRLPELACWEAAPGPFRVERAPACTARSAQPRLRLYGLPEAL